MNEWRSAFQTVIPWQTLVHSMLYLGGFDLSFLAVGTVYFVRRDFKS
jgi:hypothetical protein